MDSNTLILSLLASALGVIALAFGVVSLIDGYRELRRAKNILKWLGTDEQD